MQIKQVFMKYGGSAMHNSGPQKEISPQINSLDENNVQVTRFTGEGHLLIGRLRLPEFVDGHRHTTSEAIKHIETALKGTVNSSNDGSKKQSF